MAERNKNRMEMTIKLPSLFVYGNISLVHFVIPGLTRNPVFFWIPASAGMTSCNGDEWKDGEKTTINKKNEKIAINNFNSST